jgi:hypothetical protein
MKREYSEIRGYLVLKNVLMYNKTNIGGYVIEQGIDNNISVNGYTGEKIISIQS